MSVATTTTESLTSLLSFFSFCSHPTGYNSKAAVDFAKFVEEDPSSTEGVNSRTRQENRVRFQFESVVVSGFCIAELCFSSIIHHIVVVVVHSRGSEPSIASPWPKNDKYWRWLESSAARHRWKSISPLKSRFKTSRYVVVVVVVSVIFHMVVSIGRTNFQLNTLANR